MPLKTLRPKVSTLSPRVKQSFYTPGNETERSRYRDETQRWRKWYKTARWQKLRMTILVRDLFTCQMCKRMEPTTSQLVADHKTPHRGREVLFWDERNLQCVCAACHNRIKQREEQSSLHMRGNWTD